MNCAQIIAPITCGDTVKDYEDNLILIDKFATKLRKKYDWVYSPVDYQDEDKTWAEYMWHSLDSLITDRPDCYLLGNWKESLGCQLEVEFCKRLGLKMEEV